MNPTDTINQKANPLQSAPLGRIQYTCHPHTNSSMVKRGTYAEGVTQDEVRQRVDGSFGGRFTHFGNGSFEFITYTD